MTSGEAAPRHAPFFRKASRLSAAAAAAIGALVLLGWLFEIRVLIQVLPGQVGMVPNAAVAFILAGLALWWRAGIESRSRRYASGAAAAASGLLGLLSLIEYFTGLSLGIDKLLYLDRAHLSGFSPDRMAVVTAFSFVAIGSSLLLSNSSRTRGAGEALALAAGTFALFFLAVYAYGVRGLFWFGMDKGMALHTAAAFLILAIGVLLVRNNDLTLLLGSDTTAGMFARRILPIGILVPLLLGWLGLRGENAGLYRRDFEGAAVAVGSAVVFVALFYGIARQFRVTEEARINARAALAVSERRYREMVTFAPIGISRSTRDGRFLSVNAAFARILGYDSPDEVIALKGHRSLFFDPADGDLLISDLERGGDPLREVRMKRQDGSPVWVRTASRAVRDASGAGEYLEGFVHDISERKQAEEEIHQLNAGLERRVAERTVDLEAANKELEAFSYSVSHDLRAPLRAVDGFSRILLEDHAPQLDADGKRLLDVVRSNARQMGRLIDDLLSFSRSGRQEIARSSIDMESLVKAAFDDLKAADEAISFAVGPLPPADGDPSLMRQVWVNLISNALKFTRPKAERVIDISGRAEPGRVVYSVKDNGVGFDVAYANKLFGVFQRLHSSQEFEGTGVGLALVQRIVHRHGGEVWAEGRVGEGATFSFSLPRPGGSS